MIRLILIPFIFWSYINEYYSLSLGLIFLSGITDVFDGMIARKFNQISNLGKILDPIADKCTQICVVLLILFGNIHDMGLCVMFVILCIKEISTLLFGAMLINSGNNNVVSKWFGKFSTVCLYITMIIYALKMLLMKLEVIAPQNTMDIIATVCAWITACALVYSMIGYMKCYVINKDNSKDESGESK
ncbi:MAG: CDP-alcohol phosphatidyltransferase family protein [Oscillospiraceae bacterium]|nr:CDP-alcohol phosphatidyltransferase family protein [Candidatus Equicaccousia limihippi]